MQIFGIEVISQFRTVYFLRAQHTFCNESYTDKLKPTLFISIFNVATDHWPNIQA